MEFIINILLENKILLLFLVIALGYFIGKINLGGFSFGVAAVLFVGIAIGSLHPEMNLPDMIYTLGLVLFVYTIGLRSGASFFASFKKSGLRDNLFVAIVLTLAAILTLLIGNLLGMKKTLIAGLYCGALTNTPALAAVIESLQPTTLNLSVEATRALLSEPVVGYSLAYPIGVMGVIILFQIGMKIWHVDMKTEQKATAEITGISGEDVLNTNIVITNPQISGKTIGEIEKIYNLEHFIISRHLPQGKTEINLPKDDTVLNKGDIITLVGNPSELKTILKLLGQKTDTDLSLDRKTLDFRRIFVSRKAVIGKTIEELALHQKFNAMITRLRRGDMDLPIEDDMVLEAGDRVRVIAPKENMNAISKFFGDSYQNLSEVDYISISIGISLGLLLGMIPIPLPNGTSFKLGFAAGPLLVALILGKISRTGNVIWIMSYNANFTLRQIGVVFFLAGIGLKAGYSFFSTFQTAGLQMIVAGAIITILTAGTTILVARLWLKMPYNWIMGLMAAMHTQPACLAFANEKDNTGAANISYATVFPTAMIIKILLAQLILMW
jgi:putative transport protein